jgi:hypothetical protein
MKRRRFIKSGSSLTASLILLDLQPAIAASGDANCWYSKTTGGAHNWDEACDARSGPGLSTDKDEACGAVDITGTGAATKDQNCGPVGLGTYDTDEACGKTATYDDVDQSCWEGGAPRGTDMDQHSGQSPGRPVGPGPDGMQP